MTVLGHLRLIIAQMTIAPIATFLLLAFSGGLVGFEIQRNGGFSPIETTILVLAVILTVIFLKTALMFIAYRLLSTQRFDGSFLLIAMLVTPLLIFAMVLAAAVVGRHVESFPSDELPWLLVGLYVFVAAFLFGVFRASYWIFGLVRR